ncbi:hypothetical protein EV426DRAFT_686507 [Tirmania nivea]|nr:hypothetical protein EV426DRAFT_686507 [Tirmania nivea]
MANNNTHPGTQVPSIGDHLSPTSVSNSCHGGFSTAVAPEALGNLAADPTKAASAAVEQKITPWEVEGAVVDGKVQAIDYGRLIKQFGTQRIGPELLERFEKATGHRPHILLRRGMFFSHRNLELILERYEKGLPFFLVHRTGWLQDVFDVPLVIMLTDDEKYLFRQKLEISDVKKFTRENVADIIAVGFDVKKTFIFSDFDFMGGAFYENIDCIGKIHFASVQAATAFSSTFPHIFGTDPKKNTRIPSLIPCAIDQDPYFRLTRDVATRLKYIKPALMHSLPRSARARKKKINKYAFSGGQPTLEEQRKYGGNPDVDVSFQYLSFFLESDEELARIRETYVKGELTSGELKAKCIKELQDFVGGFQERRKAVTPEIVLEFMRVRPLEWGSGKESVKEPVEEVARKVAEAVIN